MSGDELFKPRARIVRYPDRPRARIVGVNDFVPIFEEPRVIGPQGFIEEFRRKVGLAPGKPLRSGDFYKMGQEYPKLTPVLIHNPGAHWVLVREIERSSIEVYDPVSGLRRIENPNMDKFWYLCPSDHPTREYPFMVNRTLPRASRDRYSLPREPLARLGPIQTDALNCGPLMIYAALVAKGHIKSP